MDLDKLEELGLTRGEARVYVSLLKRKESKAGPIAKDTGLNRTTVYKSLDSLIRKGMATYAVKENRKYFSPSNPKNLESYLKEQENEIRKKRKESEETLKDLEALFLQRGEEAQVTIYKGYRGLKSVFNDILRETKKEYLAMGIPEHSEIFYKYFEEFDRELAKKRVKRRIIFERDVKKNIESCIKQGYDVRVVDKKFLSPSEVNIYGKNVALVVWEEVPTVIVIKSRAISASFRSYFELLWKTAKRPHRR